MRTACATAGLDGPPAKPRGGYRIITAAVLAAAWWAYRRKLIRLVDLRVWFAAHEMDARRCRVEPDLPRRFTIEELRNLTGLSPRRLKDSLRRLQAARLLSWSDSALGLPESPDDLPVDEPDNFGAFLNRIPNLDRKVPVPRRILRLLAGGARPALIATVLGHLIRGLYLKSGRCLGRGRVKASWIADTFGVSLRRVKQARHELIASGWLVPLDADQWALNRWGAHFRINLDWSRLDCVEPVLSPATTDLGEPTTYQDHPISEETSPVSGPELAPPPALDGPELAPPDSDKEPLYESEKNQKPASGRPAGISISNFEENASIPKIAQESIRTSAPPALANSPPRTPVAQAAIPPIPSPVVLQSSLSARSCTRLPARGKPDLRDVVPEDLKDTGRLLELYDQAVSRGWVTTSERDRLRFVGAAEHARVIGTKNPCGLFVRLVRSGLWSFLTQDDEDAANARLKRHLYGMTIHEQTPQISPVREAVELSEDARLVRAIRSAVARARYQGDAFPLLRREHPEWTRERWDRALAELEQALHLGLR
jgi:hypothetical protein